MPYVPIGIYDMEINIKITWLLSNRKWREWYLSSIGALQSLNDWYIPDLVHIELNDLDPDQLSV